VIKSQFFNDIINLNTCISFKNSKKLIERIKERKILLKSIRYKNIDVENEEINSNKEAQREIADVEFAEELEVKKINPNNQSKVRPENNVQKNMNHIRNKQLY